MGSGPGRPPASARDGAPPPPGPVTDRGPWEDDERAGKPASAGSRGKVRPAGARFDAELDITELDDRERPGPTWTGKGRELSRSHLVLRSRRMSYVGRTMLVAIHLIDDRPVPLFGRVYQCEYDGDGQYKIGLDLLPVPERPETRDWIMSRGQ